MAFDPAAGFPLDPAAAVLGRLAALERRLRDNPGAQAGGGFSASVLAVDGVAQTAVLDSATVNAQAGPSASLRVPEPGGFVQFYCEAQGRFTALDAALPGANMSWLVVQLVDDVWLAGDSANGINGARGNDAELNSNLRLGFPSAWTTIRQPGVPAPDPTKSQGAQGYAGMGVLGVQWSPPGARTFRIGCLLTGQGMAAGPSSAAEFRNRRLMARVLQ